MSSRDYPNSVYRTPALQLLDAAKSNALRHSYHTYKTSLQFPQTTRLPKLSDRAPVLQRLAAGRPPLLPRLQTRRDPAGALDPRP
eukprot:697910-Rhodomonas_salina.1